GAVAGRTCCSLMLWFEEETAAGVIWWVEFGRVLFRSRAGHDRPAHLDKGVVVDACVVGGAVVVVGGTVVPGAGWLDRGAVPVGSAEERRAGSAEGTAEGRTPL